MDDHIENNATIGEESSPSVDVKLDSLIAIPGEICEEQVDAAIPSEIFDEQDRLVDYEKCEISSNKSRSNDSLQQVEVTLETKEDRGHDEFDQVQFIDHFSLGNPSSTVRFRNKKVMVYGLDNDEELVLETSTNHKKHSAQRIVTVKRYRTGTAGMRFLRSIYTLVTMLVVGFLLVFCFQVILFLFLNMAAGGDEDTMGSTNGNFHVFGVIASVPLHLYAMASILAMGVTVVQDTWSGNPLFQQLLGFSNDVLMEFICVVIFLFIPGTTAAITLMASMDDWWEVTAFTWVICVLLFMVVFAFLVVVNEVRICLLLIRMDHPEAATANIIRRAILISQTMFYSGRTRNHYLQKGDEDPMVIKSQTSLYSKMTLSKLCCKACFTPLDPPVREFSADEVRDVVPFYTAGNWSLERMFCRNPKKAAVFVQQGPGALRKGQLRGSVAFSLLGALLVVLLLVGVLVWYDAPVLFIILFPLLVFVFFLLPVILSTTLLYRALNTPSGSAVSIEDPQHEKVSNGAIFQVLERTRISEPTPNFCWFMLGFGVGIGFIWPMISFLVYEEYTTAFFFIILGAFSIPRLYLNPVPILRNTGPLNDIPFSRLYGTNRTTSNAVDPRSAQASELRGKAKLSALVGKINNRSFVSRWMYFFGSLMVLVGLFSLRAFQEENQAFDYKVKVEEDEAFFAADFYYPPSPKLPYPTCKIAKHFSLLEAEQESNLLDIAYLAALGFSGPNETGRLLRAWFGEGQVVDEYEFVQGYRELIGRTTGVSFKLFSFPNNPGVGLMSIRGSETLLDWVVDVQLWLGAALSQIIRSIIPLGWVWTPVLDEMVYLANSVESDNLKKVSYYTTTTKFINDLLSGEYGDGKYTTLRVTGASLGGGLAIITGAQTNTTTVAISGLNAMISRRCFTPPLTVEALNTHVFNVIPDRDPIAAVDDPGRLFQRTECRAPMNSFFGCHSMWRSICELSFQCGTMGRPVLCWCVSKYGYPEPIPNGTTSFTEVCPPGTP